METISGIVIALDDGNRMVMLGPAAAACSSKEINSIPTNVISFGTGCQQSLRQILKTGLNMPFTKIRHSGSVVRVGKSNKLVIAESH